MRNHLLMLIVGACIFLAIPEDASAMWGITEVFYSGDSGYMAGYSATIRDEWDLGWSVCQWEDYDADGFWFCRQWAYYDFSFAVDSWLMRPSSEWLYIGRGYDYLAAGYGYELYPGTEYGNWLGWGDHFFIRDEWYQICWGWQPWECTGLIYTGALWFFLGSTAQDRAVDPPYIHTAGGGAGECYPVTRGTEITLLLGNPATAVNVRWKFVADGRPDGIDNQNLGGQQWRGVMVRNGTATVEWDGGSSSCYITVGVRGWRAQRTPVIHPNGAPNNQCGAPLTSPVRITNNIEINLGLYCGTVDTGPANSSWTAAINDGGPNQGWWYFRNPPVVVTDWKMHPELIDPTSAFSLAQCGRNGFISYADLFRNVARHERNDIVNGVEIDAASHHWVLGRILSQSIQLPGWVHPGEYMDDRVWGPGDTSGRTSQEYLVDTINQANIYIALIKPYQDMHIDIPPVDQDANGNRKGLINVADANGNFQPC